MKRPLCDVSQRIRETLAKGLKPVIFVPVLAISATLVACPPAPKPAPAAASTAKHAHRWYQIGKASWYGRSFQGKRTANGEPFNMNALTCAHPTLPLGSWLRVTNLHTHRSIFVRVNDRGPYVAGTIIDLSYAAAQKVGLLGKAEVRVEPVSPADTELAHALLAQLSSNEQARPGL